ncbi:MAG: hypothetical protein ABIJ03_00530 [Patescibacteria group bacterium]
MFKKPDPKDQAVEEVIIPPSFVLTCGDEGVQINVGRRLSLIGVGVGLDGADKVIEALKKLFSGMRLAASGENDWVKNQLKLDDWAQTDATMQKQVEAVADKHNLLYAGFLPFTDPRQLKHDIKGHMVRPKNVHVASNICFTLGGGEQTYNLGQYQVSAEWLHLVDIKLARTIIKTQLEFYTQVSGLKKLAVVIEEAGELDKKVIAKNKQILQKIL